jgi:hypothetical protein
LNEVLRGIARFGLPAAVGGERSTATSSSADTIIAPRPLPAGAWAELFAEVRRLRLGGLLAAAVDAGALPVTASQRADIAEHHLAACAAVLGLERALLDASAQLQAAGLPALVLKGTAHAHLLYPDPSWRLFGDNDLLVRSEHLGAVVEIFQRVGYERPVPQVTAGFDARFGKGATLRHARGDELDLHRTLLFGTFGLLIDADELFGTSVPFTLGGVELRALGPETRLLHACYHAALGDPVPRLGALRDVAQALACPHDPGRVLELVRAWRAQVVLARAFALLRRDLGTDVAGPIAAEIATFRPDRRERRAVASYVGGRRSFSAKVLASLPYVDGAGGKLMLLRAAVLPDRALRRSFGDEPGLRWLGRGIRTLTGRSGR